MYWKRTDNYPTLFHRTSQLDELIWNREENLAKRQDHELAEQRRIQEKEAHDKKMLLIDTMIEVLKIVFYYIWGFGGCGIHRIHAAFIYPIYKLFISEIYFVDLHLSIHLFLTVDDGDNNARNSEILKTMCQCAPFP